MAARRGLTNQPSDWSKWSCASHLRYAQLRVVCCPAQLDLTSKVLTLRLYCCHIVSRGTCLLKRKTGKPIVVLRDTQTHGESALTEILQRSREHDIREEQTLNEAQLNWLKTRPSVNVIMTRVLFTCRDLAKIHEDVVKFAVAKQEVSTGNRSSDDHIEMDQRAYDFFIR